MLTSNADSLTPFRKAFQDTLFEEGKYYTIGLTVYESIGVEDIAFLFELQKKKNILFFNIALKIEAFNLDSIKLFAERINQLDNLHSGFHINIVGNELLVREKPDIDHPVLKVFLEKIKPEVAVRLIISSFGSNLLCPTGEKV